MIDPHRNRTGAAGRPALRHQSRQRYRAGAGHDARDHWRRICTTAITSSATPTASTDLRERAAEYPPERAAALTGIAAEDIVALAREYATTRPAAIRLNYGVQRSERGAHGVARPSRCCRRSPGPGRKWAAACSFPRRRRSSSTAPALERPICSNVAAGPRSAPRQYDRARAGAHEWTIRRCKAMVVYNSNPAAIAPNQNAVLRGLRREDLFTVVLEQFQTDTADYADILLPATTFLEHTDLYLAYGHYYLQLARPALPAPGEACRTWRSSAGWRSAWVRRCVLLRIGRRHDPHACWTPSIRSSRASRWSNWIASIPCG